MLDLNDAENEIWELMGTLPEENDSSSSNSDDDESENN